MVRKNFSQFGLRRTSIYFFPLLSVAVVVDCLLESSRQILLNQLPALAGAQALEASVSLVFCL